MKNTPPQPVMNFYLLGENAAVMQSRLPVDQQCQRRIWAVAQVLNDEAQCIDVVPGMNNLTAIFDPELQRGDEVIERLKTLWELVEAEQFIPREVRIPVHYGGESGPDLAHVAAHAGMSEEAVIAAHSQAEYIVYFLGFQPGFAYLGGLPAALATPRRAEPRIAVPAGSVGIGGQQTGIYPFQSPGGWQIIGRTDLCLFDVSRETPSLLQSGDVVRFVPVDVEQGEGVRHA
ncbi:5-oxoprolinase subunit PxpB [Undibacterium sp. RuRC25W]|uniref:5-oxoprolinase subunit PxpB n=1 Tax=Undibacterium sp. RuRC25W TaxID=3413047 RepID=UPI003BF2ACED